MNIVVLPGYNCQETLEKVINAIPKECVDDIVYVDDYSTDNSTEIAKSLGIKHIIQHTYNIGYGGNQKTLYTTALQLNPDIVIMLHPDYQYDPHLIPAIVAKFQEGADVVLASRMMKRKEAIKLGMPRYKYYSNRFLTFIQNVMFNQNLSEYHTGYRAYKASVLKRIDYNALSDDFIFDNQMLLDIINRNYVISELYCPAKYEKGSSSINLKRSIRYGFLVLWYSLVYKLKRR